MYKTDVQIRVRYGETDQMGVVYYGNYPLYFEVARTEVLRRLGMSYFELEKIGIMMPVSEMHVKYLAAAKYDDLLTITVYIQDLPTVRMFFTYEVYNKFSKLLTTASTTLVFVRKTDFKPIPAPKELLKVLEPFLSN